MKRGFIVIDGVDGVGKATQTKLLVERLKKDGAKVKTIDFPRYYNNFFGKLVGEYLSGKYGDFIKIDPHIASVLFAADRFESRDQITEWLKKGFTVIADRYVSANQIHQGGKIKDLKKRRNFIGWLEKMEYEIFKISRPDLIIYLDLPIKITQTLLKKKLLEYRRYAKGKLDVAEDNLLHLEASRRSALSMIKERNNWIMIDCEKDGEIKTREEIHEEIFGIIQSKFPPQKK